MLSRTMFVFVMLSAASCGCIDLSEGPTLDRYYMHKRELEAKRTAPKEPRPANYTGVWATWWTNGKKKEEMNFLDGKLHGHYRMWFYETGKLAEEGNYIQGKSDGRWRYWRLNGTVFEDITYMKGQRNGPYTWYTVKEGIRAVTGEYLDGQQHGKWITLDKAGKVEEIRYFNRGKLISTESIKP